MKELMNGGNQVCNVNGNVVIGRFDNGQPLQVSRQFLDSITDEEYCVWDIDKTNYSVGDIIKSIEYSGFGDNSFLSGDFCGAKYKIAIELVGRMNFTYSLPVEVMGRNEFIYIKVIDNNDGTVSITSFIKK